MLQANKKAVHQAPETPGIYQFKDITGNILYVGKAKNLRNRLDSYFSNQILPKTAQMLSLAKTIDYIKVTSEFEALLLEANLIKKYKPKYNIQLKDDKSPLYIGITKDYYPRIVIFRKPQMDQFKLKEYFGPFLAGTSVKKVLRIIRKIFPYSTHLPTGKICIYKQIGLCDPCPSEIENEIDENKKRELRIKYLRNVRNVKNLLNGKITNVQKDLEKEIKEYSKREEFEEAEKIALQLKMFQDVAINANYEMEEYLENPNLSEDLRNQELDKLQEILNKFIPNFERPIRIECFDIAHLAGSFPTASMVTFINGEADKRFYRHFKINNKKGNSDVDSMKEVISRRLNHLEDWGRPDLVIIDGGKPQLSVVGNLLEEKNIPYVGLAKQFETIVIKNGSEYIELRAKGVTLNLFQRIRDEAHRFARRLHHKHVKNSMKI
ncbi:excinuclease ABC subunit UvrC [soil metagenome]